MNYAEQMQSLINKTVIDIVIILVLIIVIMGIIWLLPFLLYKNHKKRGNSDRKSTAHFKKSLTAQVILTVICLLFSLTTVSNFQDISNMKKDIAENSFVTYVGSYEIADTYHFSFSISELWFDLRPVTVEDNSEPLWFDKMSDADVNIKGTGRIVYGKNSRCAVTIQSQS